MTRNNPLGGPPEASDGSNNAWAAFGYLVAGVLVYGLLGWGLSVWLHAAWLIPVGILVGAGLGLYLVYARVGKIPKPTERLEPFRSTQPFSSTEPPSTTRPEDPPRSASDDRGDTE